MHEIPGKSKEFGLVQRKRQRDFFIFSACTPHFLLYTKYIDIHFPNSTITTRTCIHFHEITSTAACPAEFQFVGLCFQFLPSEMHLLFSFLKAYRTCFFKSRYSGRREVVICGWNKLRIYPAPGRHGSRAVLCGTVRYCAAIKRTRSGCRSEILLTITRRPFDDRQQRQHR